MRACVRACVCVCVFGDDVRLVCLVQVMVRMRQYKDDLLVSCLQLLLSLPNELVQHEFPNLVPALQVMLLCIVVHMYFLLLSFPVYAGHVCIYL